MCANDVSSEVDKKNGASRASPWCGGLLTALVLGLSACGGPSFQGAATTGETRYSAIPTPAVSAPLANEAFASPTKNYQFFASDVALASRGYVEEEFFIDGKARAYDIPVPVFGPTTLPRPIGKRVVHADVPYKTRMVVRRPVDPQRFNGTVVIEWLNVTDGFDGEYFWVQGKDHLLRAGYAYVGLSAQDKAISGGPLSLKQFSPARYGTLDVTGKGKVADDGLSYDIFAQAAKVARSVPRVMDGLQVRHVIGVGMSQAGMRLASYANYLHQEAPIYDAFLIQVANQTVRDDLKTPLIKVLSETEASPKGLAEAQPDTATRRTWWVAGSNHGDATQRLGRTGVRLRDLGLANTGNDACDGGKTPTRSRVPFRHVVNAAIDHLNKQIQTGAVPPRGDSFKTERKGADLMIARDAHGNAIGGIRLAHLEVPTARASGNECAYVGAWVPFDEQTIKSLYPSHAAYVARVDQAVKESVSRGFVLPDDGAETLAEAQAALYGRGYACGVYCLSERHFRVDFSSTGLLREHVIYYNPVRADELLAAVDAAHLWIARGYSQPEGSAARRADFQAGVTQLQRFMAVVESARGEKRLTGTAADLLRNEAEVIVRGISPK